MKPASPPSVHIALGIHGRQHRKAHQREKIAAMLIEPRQLLFERALLGLRIHRSQLLFGFYRRHVDLDIRLKSYTY
jgi:hypothetical protein